MAIAYCRSGPVGNLLPVLGNIFPPLPGYGRSGSGFAPPSPSKADYGDRLESAGRSQRPSGTATGSGGAICAHVDRASKYSTDNQATAIASYAARRGYEIVRTYAGEGKSGLNLGGRAALQQLLDDIECGRADYAVVLVYDVSRWGRFQDPDEAATYELRCHRAGVAVHYCAEQFENDGSIGSSIIKTVKRAMAGEYSRELSVKVFAGQANLIRLGYRQGGAAGFGLRRLLVDQSGTAKTSLIRGEHKSIATDRVILVPGPADEIAVVREVYRLFVDEGRPERAIAAILNARGIPTDLGRPWTRGSVHQLLINEKYIGNNVWARTSFKLKQAHIRNPPEVWLRLLPGLVGRPRVFAREEVTPLVALTSWAETLERQAGEGASRLRELHLYAGQVERQLADVRRPAALRRVVAVALGSWSVWAAKLARDTRVDISSAWRTLQQAADLGLVVAVPGQKRSRGDGTLYAPPPWLRMAGLMSVRRGRPTAAVLRGSDGAGLGDAVAELDAAMAAADRLLSL